jgi:S1-C subfamily serine protease
MKGWVALALGLLLVGCEEPETATTTDSSAAAPFEVDPTLLRELLGESVRVDADQIRADGMLIRLAFDPLIRQTGPVSLQLVQGQGYRLSGIADSSPLWFLGLRDGDVLTGVDKQAIIGREHELRSSYEARPGRVELTYMRGSEAHTVVLRIASGSAWRSISGPPEAPVSPLPSTAPAPPLDPQPREEAALAFALGLRCVEAESGERPLIGRCELERKVVDALLAQPSGLMKQARIVPAVVEGEARGFKIYGVRPNSIPKVLGFKNGDLVTSVNGRELVSIDSAMVAYEAFRHETEFRVVLERKRQVQELEIVIVDKLSGPPSTMRGEVEPTSSPDLRDPFLGR